jgi:hypothetical protein
MLTRREDFAPHRLALLGALLAIAGILLSGPLAAAVIHAVRPQPQWHGVGAFVAAYHPVQLLPYFFGFFFVGGCVVLVVGMHGLAPLERRAACLLGVVASGIGATLVFLNYVLQTTFVPALVRAGQPEQEALLGALTMVNPASLAWALEMWGYAFLGLGSWIAARALDRGLHERIVRWLLAANGLVGIVGAGVTVARLDWVLGTAGLASYAAWNVLFLVTLALAATALHRRIRGGVP